jgi:type I restriction enzyme, R subunit
MSEYTSVQKPFLKELENLGWTVIDQEAAGIPVDPTVSLRENFKEVVLKETFLSSIRSLNTVGGQEWLTDAQLEHIYNDLMAVERSNSSLLESNKAIFKLLVGKTKITVDKNELTGDTNVLIKLVDFDNYAKNSFVAISEFSMDTTGGPREGIRPDIVLFVNGMPLVVVECKDVAKSDPLSEAIDQIKRYSNTRYDPFGTVEGEERLFHYNLFSIATHGEEARFGTITGEYEHYLNWKDIFPEEYNTIDIPKYSKDEEILYKNNGMHKAPQVRQSVAVRGMLNKEILLDILQHFTLFMEMKEGVEVKIICRYQQYRAVGKLIETLRNGTNGTERSGVVWHTQGSGKSLTMVFFIRKLRSQADLRDFRVIMMVDRKDLEIQLSATAQLTDEFRESNIIKSRAELIPKLKGDNSVLNMVMVHKLIQEEIKHSKALEKAFVEEGIVPEFKPLPVVNDSEKIVILIDEAHRGQGGDLGDALFEGFPNAAKIAFTGTPLLTDRHKKKTHERFGEKSEFIDTYKIRESVDDRATLDIVYIGKTSKDEIDDKDAFDREFEDVFSKEDKETKAEIQKKYGTMQAYLENEDRLKKIAIDLVDHYVDEILPNGYKAMVVGSSVYSAAMYQNFIQQAIKARLIKEQTKAQKDEELIEQIAFIDACTVVTMQDNNEQGFISDARKKAKELNAVENFKKDFDYSKNEEGDYLKPETGIAFLCVCDRLLTGFDAPIAQAMYLDKNIREHNLLQAIARVNRTKGTKKHGIVVDYYGVSNNLVKALKIWGAEDEEDIKDLLKYFRDINKEIPVLEARYNRVVQLFEDKGVSDIKSFLEQKINNKDDEFEVAESCIELAKEIPFRAQFDTYLKAFFDSLDLLFNSKVANDYFIPAKRLGYLLIRIRNRYKDPTMDLKWAKAKVRKLIDKHLETLNIDGKIAPVALLSDDFADQINNVTRTPKSKASEMEHAIRMHIKVNMENDPGMYTKFLKRVELLLERYKGNWDQIVEEFEQVRSELDAGRNAGNIETGLSDQESPFFDLIIMQAFNNEISDAQKELVKPIVVDVLVLLKQKMDKPNFWQGRDAQIKKLSGELDDILDFSGVEEIASIHEKLSAEILSLAKIRHNLIIGN